MRVVGGFLSGRTFKSPSGNRTHPMSEKVRGALFNMLGDLSGLRVLDAFSGSGALAIEAGSRGARQIIAIDLDKAAFDTITENIHVLALDSRCTVIRANAGSWSNKNAGEAFDVVLLDPPYDAVSDYLLTRLMAHTKPGGVAVLSLPPHQQTRIAESFDLLSEKSYGDATLRVYRRKQSAQLTPGLS